jgi:hypothetical protein
MPTPDLRPTTLWTLRTPQGTVARAVLIPQGRVVILAWFLDDQPEGAEDFRSREAAMRRAEELRMAFEPRCAQRERS